jgi:DNA invertase Pin-like site-specific DNA recombinase
MNDKANHPRRCVALYRVSTAQQGRSGLGLEAQRETVLAYLGQDWRLIEEVVEVASGRSPTRPGLERAVAICRAQNAVLVIARLCRLSRDPHLLFALQRSGVDFLAVDMPGASQFAVGVMALVAQEESRMTAERTRQALAARRARGLPMGGNNPLIGEHAVSGAAASAEVRGAKARQRAAALKPVIDGLRADGANSLSQISAGLNDRGLSAPRGGDWRPQSVRDLLRHYVEVS